MTRQNNEDVVMGLGNREEASKIGAVEVSSSGSMDKATSVFSFGSASLASQDRRAQALMSRE